MLRRILSLKFFLWATAILAVLVLLFMTEENWRGRRAWEKYRAASEKRGAKLFLKDFVPADIPDDANYAAVPVIRDLFAEQEDGAHPPNALNLPGGKPPAAPNDIRSRRFEPEEWREFFLKSKLLAERTDSPARDILRALEKYEPTLQQLRDATSRPKCKFPTHWEDGISTRLPHLSFCLAATRLFCLRAQAHLALGESAAALAELNHAFRLHAAFRSELTLIAGLCRLGSLAMMEGTVWQGLAAGQWGDQELTALERRFSETNVLEDWHSAFASERGFLNAALLELVDQSPAELDRAAPGFGAGCSSSPINKWLVFRTFPYGWRYLMLVRTNDYYDWLTARLDDAAKGMPIKVHPTYQTSEDWYAAHPGHWGVMELERIFMMESLLVFESAYTRYLYTHTRTQETRLAITMERFRRKSGTFPDKLDALVPQFIDAIPKDVSDQQPLRYRRNPDGGYDLWSIGTDSKDDGGRIEPNQKNGHDQADWIWHMPGQRKVPEPQSKDCNVQGTAHTP